MVRESSQNVFLIQIDASCFAEFEISEFENRESTVQVMITREVVLSSRSLVISSCLFNGVLLDIAVVVRYRAWLGNQ